MQSLKRIRSAWGIACFALAALGGCATCPCVNGGREITQLPYRITDPGSYCVTKQLTGQPGHHGITVAGGVTPVEVDLQGNALVGVRQSRSGIYSEQGTPAITVRNGQVFEWGNDGINLQFSSGSYVERVVALLNGTDGIRTGTEATVTQCTTLDNGSRLTGGPVPLFRGEGIVVGSNSTVIGSRATNNVTNGITASYNSRITDCDSANNGWAGIRADSSSLVSNNTAIANGTGIYATGTENRIDENLITNNSQTGVDVQGAGNFVIRNTAHGNGTNYLTGSGPIGSPATATSPWANLQ